jgi:hypothetical protein
LYPSIPSPSSPDPADGAEAPRDDAACVSDDPRVAGVEGAGPASAIRGAADGGAIGAGAAWIGANTGAGAGVNTGAGAGVNTGAGGAAMGAGAGANTGGGAAGAGTKTGAWATTGIGRNTGSGGGGAGGGGLGV